MAENLLVEPFSENVQEFDELFFSHLPTDLRYKKVSRVISIYLLIVRCGIRTHECFHIPELKLGALDLSANLTFSNINKL
jgi:hypothetical protein